MRDQQQCTWRLTGGIYSRVQNKGGDVLNFFVIFADPPQLILTPLFINFLNFTRDNTEVHKYIIDFDISLLWYTTNVLEIPMLSEVNKVFICLFVACAAESNPLVYTVCVLVHDILFQIPLSRKDIYSCFWLVKTIVWQNTRQKQANQKRLYIYPYPCDSAEFETRYRALIHRRLKPLFDTNKPAAAQASLFATFAEHGTQQEHR